MILSKQDCELFFSAYDALTDFANGKWGVAPAVIDPRTGFVNEENQRKVASMVWNSPSIIDELLAEDPFNMPQDERDLIRSWHSSYTDTFYVISKDPRVVHFLSEDTAFEVCGLSREIISVLGTMPTVVTATLLPCAGKIVYAVYLEEQPIVFGQAMSKVLDDEWLRIKSSGHILTTADELIAFKPELEERRISREAERMINSLEEEMAPDVVGEGAHRGALADLSPEARLTIVRDNTLFFASANEAVDYLTPYCRRSAPVFTLAEMLGTLSQGELVSMAASFHLELPGMDRESVTGALVRWYTDPETIFSMLTTMDYEDYERVSELYDQGGRVKVTAGQMQGTDQFYPEVPLLCQPFLYRRVFTFVIPDEVMDALSRVDWLEVNEYQAQNKLLVSIANFMIELRGVCPLEDVFDAYFAASKNPLELGEALGVLAFSPRDDLALYTLWMGQDPKDSYLMHVDLARAYGGRNQSPYPRRMQQAELPMEIESLRAAQKGKQPRALSEEMLSIGDYASWARSRPATLAMCEWLDAHVPDTENDYTYANGVIDDLVIMCTQEFPLNNVTDYLSENLVLADMNQLNKVMQLFSNMNNTLPKWSNNGWSPHELREGKGGGKVFYNADGSAKCIGSFDPCPCGSGLPYKDCHGRSHQKGL